MTTFNLSYGIFDSWNIDIGITGGNRGMDFEGKANVHHRDESRAGISDFRILVRRIVKNTDFGPGQRIFIGVGAVFPGRKTIMENPYALGEKGISHTHFSISDGGLKGLVEIQYFYRSSFPILMGGVYRIEFPLGENNYGFLPGISNYLDILAYWQSESFLKAIPYFVGTFIYKKADKWDKVPTPNSEGLIFQPGFGLNWHLKDYVFTLAAQVPGLYSLSVIGDVSGNEKPNTSLWTISLSIRRTFGND